MARKNQNPIEEFTTVIDGETITATFQEGTAEEFLNEVTFESEFPVYAVGDRFTADNLFAGNKRKYYLTIENALTAQESGKYSTEPAAVEKPIKVKSEKTGAPRKTGTPVSEVALPDNWNTMKKTEQARFLVSEGVTIGDTARFMQVRFQQVYQAVSYGKLAGKGGDE